MLSYSYSPVVKGKAHDLRAYSRALEREISMKAMIDVLPVPQDKTVDQHLVKFALDFSVVPISADVFVDYYGFLPNEKTSSGVDATIAGFDMLLAAGRYVTPVYGFGRDDTMWAAFNKVIQDHGKGFCFRIELDDLDDESENTWAQVMIRTAQMGLTPAQVDLFIDLRDIRTSDADDLQERVTDFLMMYPVGSAYRSICVAGCSAPKDVTVVGRDSVGFVFRNELKVWARLKSDLPVCDDLVFGDYGIVHADFAENVPCGGTVNCKIRYTAGNSILIFRGHLRAGDSGQTHGLAQAVVDHAAFQGAHFSDGDQYVADCAAYAVGPGNPGNWVFADLNHHYVYTARQIERVRYSVVAGVSNEEIDEFLVEY